ncbi:MAG: hypothetical protein AB7O67_16910 [Vicinamibacterales bacterium]
MDVLRRFVDERFRIHRIRSSATAGMATGAAALLLFEYHLVTTGEWRLDLLGLGVLFVAVKLTLMVWYTARD